MPGDHGQVGALSELGLGAVSLGMRPEVDEDILDDVLGGRRLTEHAHRSPEHDRRQPVEDLGQRLIVPGGDPGDEQGVPRVHGAHGNPTAAAAATVRDRSARIIANPGRQRQHEPDTPPGGAPDSRNAILRM